MKVDVPDSYEKKFALFDQAEQALIVRWKADGLSRQNVIRCFAAFAAVDSCWRDPAFLVWAGSKGFTTSQDFIDHWAELYPVPSEETEVTT